MKIETFQGRDIKRVSFAAQESLGEDAMIVRTRVIPTKPPQVEVVAVAASDIEWLRGRLEAAPLRPPRPDAPARQPLTIALVGPTGAGKTTTLAKLAVNPTHFGSWRVGMLTIDTFRTGAVDQLESYAQIAGIPLEVVYAREEVAAALGRLAGCDVILIDAPGRSPRHPERNAAWMELLTEIAPREVHLVVPVGVRLEVARAAVEAYDAIGVTHLLLTKLDEVEEDAGVAEIAVTLRLPTRWVTDGQEIPLDVHAATPRILSALGGLAAGRTPLKVPA